MDEAARRRELYDICSDSNYDVEEKIERILDVGTDYLSLPIGYLTRIENDTQKIVQSVGDHPEIQPGEVCSLDNAYCKRTAEMEKPLAVNDTRVSDKISEAARELFNLGTYIGVRVVADDETIGTICFADTERRGEPFSSEEIIFVELVGQLIGQAFERRRSRQKLEARNAQLQAEKQRFEGIAESSFDVLFRLSRDSTFTYVSSAVERILGYEPAELVGRSFLELLSEDAHTAGREAYETVLSGQSVEGSVFELRDADDDTVFLEVNATPVTEHDDIISVQGVGRDVTTRRQREQELHLTNTAIDEASIGIMIADATQDGYPITYTNQRITSLTGYSEADLLQTSLLRNLEELSVEETASIQCEHLQRKDQFSTEVLATRQDGTPFWNLVRVNPVVDETGALTHFLTFQADITERKRTDQLIRLLNRVLRHNLRNEMTVILGYTDTLSQMSKSSQTDAIQRITGAAKRLVDITEQARELEQRARQERRPQRLDTTALLEQIVDEQATAYPDASIDVDIETDQHLCAGHETKRALEELVKNALAHNPDQSPHVHIEAVSDDEWIELTISDNGPGIDEIEAAVIAAGEETALEHSAGLGIWLVNWIITRYGGSFQIRPDETEGTVATVRLPAIDDETAVEVAAREPTVLFN